MLAPRDLIAHLPEDVLHTLHEQLDTSQQRPLLSLIKQLSGFEAAVVDRLFPLRDERRNIVRLRLHSHATAIAAAVVAEQSQLPRQSAFVCGWLHDMGIASCFAHLDDLAKVFDSELHEQAWPPIRRSAPRHAIQLASRWRLPSSIRYSIRDHVGFDTTTAPSDLACVTFVAEHVASAQGCGFWDEQPAVGLLRALSTLRLTKRDLLSLERRTEQLLGALQLEWQCLAITHRA
jgi:HD-like signal output (HDOD) protein